MDNEAFRALVNKGAKAKTTKEIAREAVEEEFKFKKQQRRKKHGSTRDSDDDVNDDSSVSSNEYGNRNDKDDADEKDNGPEKEKNSGYSKKRKNKDESQQSQNQYRDRAKERRKGLDIDYKSTTDLLKTAAGALDDKDMSKYLGGDEEHTHLVKGLDLALAQKVKREQKKLQSQAMQNTNSRQVSNEKAENKNQNLSRQDVINRLQVIIPKSTAIGQHVIQYLLSKHKYANDNHKHYTLHSTSLAGRNLQRSTLTFNLLANAKDKSKAWEVPVEYTRSKYEQQQHDSRNSVVSETSVDLVDDSNNRVGYTSLDDSFLKKIESILIPPMIENDPKAKKKKKMKKDKKNEETDANDDSPPLEKESNTDQTKGNVSESDDDIFSGIGEYFPPTKKKKEQKPETKTTNTIKNEVSNKKTSIFENLGYECNDKPSQNENPINPQQTLKLNSFHKSQPQGKVIDRDVFGTNTHASKHHTSFSTTRGKGVVLSSYDGGYGEDMDVDFDGTLMDAQDDDDDDNDDKKDKNKKKKKSMDLMTTAAKEYGSRSKKSNKDNPNNLEL